MASIGQYRGTDITPGSDEQVRAQIDAIDASQPISTQSLQQQPAFTIPPAPTPTASAGFQGQMETFVGSLQSAADASKKQKDQSGRMLADALFNQQGEADLTNMLYGSDDGVDDRRAELDDINQQILQEQEGLRREIEAIQDNTEGLTRGAVAGRIDETRRRSLRTQADLAVVQLAKQGRYDSAKAIADRAIAVQLEKQKQTLDTLKFLYEENKDQFDKDEQRAFEVAQGERERALDAEAEERRSVNAIMIEAARNGAPSSVLTTLSGMTPDQAVAATAQYLGAEFRVKTRQLALQESAQNLAYRKSLLEMAALGDQQAIKELGYDPNDMPLSGEQILGLETQRSNAARDLTILNRALLNNTGIEGSAGLIRGGLLGAQLEAPLGLLGAPYAAAKKNDFLADAGYIVKNLTFGKIKELSDSGIKLTPISEKELKAMGDASNVLVSAAQFDENGNLVGFKISEDRVREQLRLIGQHYANAIDDITVDLTLTPAEQKEILGN